MNSKSYLQRAFAIEFPMTRRVLERLPEESSAWIPHAKSMPLGQLSMHIARLPDLLTTCLRTPAFDAATQNPPDTTFHSRENLLETFDGSASTFLGALDVISEQELGKAWEFSFQKQVFSEETRAVTLLHMGLGHLAHHRAQLGTYLRQLNIPLPPLYGPSADERPQLRPPISLNSTR